MASNENYIYCTREQFAGPLPLEETTPPAYRHSLIGQCKCGKTHPGATVRPDKPKATKGKRDRKPLGRVVASYFYADENGQPRYKIDRHDPKDFRQYQADGVDGRGVVRWKGGMQGIERLPYQLRQLIASKESGKVVFVVEGEKDVDRLISLGLIATTIPEGAKVKPDGTAGKPNPHIPVLVPHLADRDVVVIADNDAAGHAHANAIARALHGVASSVKVFDLTGIPGIAIPPKGDASDYFDLGGTVDALVDLVPLLPEWAPGDDEPATVKIADIQGGEGEPDILVVDTNQWRVIDEAELALAADETIFTRATKLVRVVTEASQNHRWQPDRPTGSPRIALVELPTLSEKLSKHALWKKWVRREGEDVLAAAIPPQWAVTGLAARACWPNLRPLTGIIETPTIRKDGTILDVEGWDSATGLLYTPSAKFGQIPENPTQADAAVAADLLLDLVCDVPFKDRRHAMVWLAALLTVIARHAVDGPTPLFVFSANIRATGKSLLCDLIYGITANREMPRCSMPSDEEEMGKVVTSIAMAGDPVTMFDNVATGTPIGGEILDKILVSTTHKGRLLGTNSHPILPWHSVLFVTGNNLYVRADTFYRSCISYIESDEVRPEERKNFKVKGCLVKHAMSRRVELVEAALTILRAHAVAGRPGVDDLPRIRTNYHPWSDVIRAAVYWSTGIDPCEIHEDERAIDQDATTVDTLVSGWKAVCEAEKKTSMSVADVLKAVGRSPEDHAGLRDLFMTWSRDKELPSSKSVGRRLAQYRKRPSQFGSLDQTPPQRGVVSWFVREPKSTSPDGAFGGFGGFTEGPTRERRDDIPDTVNHTTETDQRGSTNPPKAPKAPREVEL